MLFAFVYTNNAISERNEAIMKYKKISIGACILALVLIAGATTAFAATATNDNGSHISRSDAVLIDVDGNFQKVDVTGEVDSSDVHFISDCNLQMVDVTNETNSSDVWFISNYNGLTLVEVQNDNSKNILDDTGDSFISLAKDAPVTLGVGSWKQGDTFVLECKNEGSNAIKINIRNTSSGENWPYTLETGTGSITFTAPYDGEFEITVENLSDTDANLSISYTLTR